MSWKNNETLKLLVFTQVFKNIKTVLLLYGIDKFYIELVYNIDADKIVEVHSFKTGHYCLFLLYGWHLMELLPVLGHDS